jgi:hypothetical protein
MARAQVANLRNFEIVPAAVKNEYLGGSGCGGCEERIFGILSMRMFKEIIMWMAKAATPNPNPGPDPGPIPPGPSPFPFPTPPPPLPPYPAPPNRPPTPQVTGDHLPTIKLHTHQLSR